MKKHFLAAAVAVFMLIIASAASAANDNCQCEGCNSTQADMPCDSVLRRLAANMLMVGFKGDSVTENSDAARYVRDLHVGCIVLFDVDLTGDATIGSRNITSVDRLQSMTKQLREWSDTPLLIALDQEGGRVARLKTQYGFQPTVSAEYLGDLDNQDSTRHYAAMIANDLHRAGINLNLAPVVDILSDSCPVIAGAHRAFSRDPQAVARNAGWFVDECHKRGAVCALKHFPGHGSSTGDTHFGLVDVTSTWTADELIPFKRIIDAGLADAIMTAHIYNRSIDPQYPATLSEKTLTGVLRESLGFDGVIVTDDVYMEGIVGEYGVEDALVLAINAGADMICAGNNGRAGFEANRPMLLVDMIVKAVKDGRIPIERVYEANARINALKEKYKVD